MLSLVSKIFSVHGICHDTIQGMAKLSVIAPIRTEKAPAIEPVKHDPVLDREIEKTFEFEMFLLWESIPSFFKNPPADKKTGNKPEPRPFCEAMGIDDERILELCEIPTASAFGIKYGVHRDTLTDWRKIIRNRDLLGDLREWASPLTRNVLMALYNQCLRGGLPEHYKLWLQSVAQFSEKSVIDINKRVIKKVVIEVLPPQT